MLQLLNESVDVSMQIEIVVHGCHDLVKLSRETVAVFQYQLPLQLKRKLEIVAIASPGLEARPKKLNLNSLAITFLVWEMIR